MSLLLHSPSPAFFNLKMALFRYRTIRAFSCSPSLQSTPITSIPFNLLGPPELYLKHPPPCINTLEKHEKLEKSSSSGDPFMDLMSSNFNKTVTTPLHLSSIRGYTENGSPTYVTSGNPCVDFFFHVVPDTSPETLIGRLELAWKHDALTTLKLIAQLRGVRGTGKSDKEGFYTAALWLHENHPKTLAINAKWFANIGYYKDLPEILLRILEGSDTREERKRDHSKWLSRQNDPKLKFMPPAEVIASDTPRWVELHRDPSTGSVYYYNEATTRSIWVSRAIASAISESPPKAIPLPPGWQETTVQNSGEKFYLNMTTGELKKCIGCSEGRDAYEWGYCHFCTKQLGQSLRIPQETRLAAENKKREFWTKKMSEFKNQKELEKAKRTVERYYNDPDFRFLHDEISQVFADQLIADIKHLESGKKFNISFAAKWCPNLYSFYDKITLLCESIAKRVFPRELYPEYEGVEEAHYAYRVRDRLRKEVLVPLHKLKELPEIYICGNKWDILPYKYVPSVAMKNYKDLFLKHDEERFKAFLGDVKTGKAKIAAGALLPHQIIEKIYDSEDGGEVAELQWKRMVEDVSAKGKLVNCIAVCDVSGSMDGKPMDVCVALGLLLSELSEEPWKGNVITFSENPQLHKIQGDDLKSKTRFIQDMEWGMNTDFQKVFDNILQVAVSGNLSKDMMIKKIFVFSDMEFDDARGVNNYSYCYGRSSHGNDINSGDGKWETDYEVIKEKFEEHGYEAPQIVFWNLRDSSATPVQCDEKGVALVSGFSKNLLSIFVDGKDIPTPEMVMEKALDDPQYKQLVVVD